MEASFEWSVELPERGSSRRGFKRPLAKVVCLDNHAQGPLLVSVSVGRRLKKLLGSPSASSRTPSELSELVEVESASCARERIASLVNRRDYSASELIEKLVQDGYDRALAESSVVWAQEVRLVDDRRFAESFARAKALSGWGRLRIERELERRGVHVDDRLLADEDLFDEHAERERAFAIAARRVRGDASDYARIVRCLTSKGFSYALSLDVAHELAGTTVYD